MPSVKSYQNRKHDIEVLRRQLQNYDACLNRQREEFRQVLAVRDAEISKLYKHVNHYVNTLADYLAVMPAPPTMIMNQEKIEVLKKEIETLNIRLRLYREYILKTYPETTDALTLTEIPNCLKPFDSIAYLAREQDNKQWI